MALAGAVLGGRYELDKQIGCGGYGEVWRAMDTVLSRAVAVKLLYPGSAQQPEALVRFHAEARHAGALAHQNIARVYDYGEPADGPSPYLVMELVGGPSLSDALAGGPLDTARTMDVIAQTAAGLQAAHAVGLVHRDVKPANLLLHPDGTVKITDFGIASSVGSVPVTASGELVGTPGYLAPERVAGEQVTPASDLYALGIVAYECLAGAPPFTGTPLEVALAHRIRPLPPLPPSVPLDVGALVMHLTAKDPAWRPASAAEVAHCAGRLRDALRAGTVGGPDSPAGPPARDSSPGWPARALVTVEHDRRPDAGRPHRRSILSVAAVVLAGVTGLVLASSTGFSSGSHPASVSSSPSPGHSSGTHWSAASVAAPPAPPANPVTSARRQSAGDPAAGRPGGDNAVITAGKPGHKKGKGHGQGGGPGNGGGGQGDGNAQD